MRDQFASTLNPMAITSRQKRFLFLLLHNATLWERCVFDRAIPFDKVMLEPMELDLNLSKDARLALDLKEVKVPS